MTINQLAKVLRQRGIKHMGPHNLFSGNAQAWISHAPAQALECPPTKIYREGLVQNHGASVAGRRRHTVRNNRLCHHRTGPAWAASLFMDKYGISRQLSLLDGRRSYRARTVPAPRKVGHSDRPPPETQRHRGHAGHKPRCGRFDFAQRGVHPIDFGLGVAAARAGWNLLYDRSFLRCTKTPLSPKKRDSQAAFYAARFALTSMSINDIYQLTQGPCVQ